MQNSRNKTHKRRGTRDADAESSSKSFISKVGRTLGIQGEYKVNTRGIKGEYKGNTKGIQEEYKRNTRGIQEKYKSNTRGIQGEYKGIKKE